MANPAWKIYFVFIFYIYLLFILCLLFIDILYLLFIYNLYLFFIFIQYLFGIVFSGRFTAPADGVYRFMVMVKQTADNGPIAMYRDGQQVITYTTNNYDNWG